MSSCSQSIAIIPLHCHVLLMGSPHILIAIGCLKKMLMALKIKTAKGRARVQST